MVMLSEMLAHNVVMWAKRWLKAEAPKLAGYGVPRMVRDVASGERLGGDRGEWEDQTDRHQQSGSTFAAVR